MANLCPVLHQFPNKLHNILRHLHLLKTYQNPGMENHIINFLIIIDPSHSLILRLLCLFLQSFTTILSIKSWYFIPKQFLLHDFCSTRSKLNIYKYSYTLLDIIPVFSFHMKKSWNWQSIVSISFPVAINFGISFLLPIISLVCVVILSCNAEKFFSQYPCTRHLSFDISNWEPCLYIEWQFHWL